MLGNPVGALWHAVSLSLWTFSSLLWVLLLYCLMIVNPAFSLSRLTFMGHNEIENSLPKDETSWVKMDTGGDKIRLMQSPPTPPPEFLPQQRSPSCGRCTSQSVCFRLFLMEHEQLLNRFQLDEWFTWITHLPLLWPFPSRSSSVSTRSSLAHLYSAGFPPIVDYNGQVAEVLDPTEPVPFDLQSEETDFLQDNLLMFQFLAFTRWGLSYWVTRHSVVTAN